MTPNKKLRIALIVLFALSIVVLLIYGPVPQWADYHNFADQRSFFSIPNFWDVISNVPFFFIGIWGFNFLRKTTGPHRTAFEWWIYPIFFTGILLAFFGSAYYHWQPTNASLLWDRLPMTLMFTGLFAILIYDFVDPDWGKWAGRIGVPFGVLSLVYWQWTESMGQGDLRPYALVQFFPMIAGTTAILLSRFKASYLSSVIWIIVWYAFAKVFEHFDDEVFAILPLSGHTIKHFLGAVTLIYAARFIVQREQVLKRRTGITNMI